MAAMMRCAQRLLVVHDLRTRRVQGLRAAVEARHRAAVELRQQLALVRRDQIDQVLIERLPLGEGLALAHRRFGQRAVAPALGRDAAQVGGGVVLHLLLHHRVHLAAHQHRMRRAGVGARRHRRHIAGFQNEEARRCGAPAARAPHRSPPEPARQTMLLDRVAHGVHQAAGRVQANQQQRGVFAARPARWRRATISAVIGMHHAIHVHRDRLSGRRADGLRHQRKRQRTVACALAIYLKYIRDRISYPKTPVYRILRRCRDTRRSLEITVVIPSIESFDAECSPKSDKMDEEQSCCQKVNETNGKKA